MRKETFLAVDSSDAFQLGTRGILMPAGGRGACGHLQYRFVLPRPMYGGGSLIMA